MPIPTATLDDGEGDILIIYLQLTRYLYVYILFRLIAKVARAGAGLKSKVAYLGGIVWRQATNNECCTACKLLPLGENEDQSWQFKQSCAMQRAKCMTGLEPCGQPLRTHRGGTDTPSVGCAMRASKSGLRSIFRLAFDRFMLRPAATAFF